MKTAITIILAIIGIAIELYSFYALSKGSFSEFLICQAIVVIIFKPILYGLNPDLK